MSESFLGLIKEKLHIFKTGNHTDLYAFVMSLVLFEIQFVLPLKYLKENYVTERYELINQYFEMKRSFKRSFNVDGIYQMKWQ